MQSLVVEPQGHSEGPQGLDITFDNRAERLIGLGAVNGGLKVLTLGLYAFWAKTDVRRKLWSFTRLNGEPLEYTGTGKELFLGFLIVFGAVVLPVLLGGFAVAFLFPGNKVALTLYQLSVYAVFFLLLGNAIYRAQRYRLSRTRWRGIRGALTGSPAGYGWTYFWTLTGPFAVIALAALLVAWRIGPQVGGAIMLIGFVAGLWVLPWRSNKLQGLLTRDMFFGDRPLSYTGTSGPLYRRYLYAWAGSALIYLAAIGATAIFVLRNNLVMQWQLEKIMPSLPQVLTLVGIWAVTLLTSAMITAWYRANQMKHFAVHTHFECATFRSDVTGKGLMWLVLSNWMLSFFGLILGALTGGLLMYALGAVPAAAEPGGLPREPGPVQIALAVIPVIVLTTIASTFAQFRSARYFLSRLKLDGRVSVASILQSQDLGPKRGEGLAQVFDLDAF